MATIQSEQITFLWEGRDKRGVRLKGQQVATTPNLVRISATLGFQVRRTISR